VAASAVDAVAQGELAIPSVTGLDLVASANRHSGIALAARNGGSGGFFCRHNHFRGDDAGVVSRLHALHAWPQTRAKCVLQVFDHSAIFLLIAGTYTPFTLGPLRGVWGWSILGLIWALAIFGIIMKVMRGRRAIRNWGYPFISGWAGCR